MTTVVPTGRMARWLRRWVPLAEQTCPNGGNHEAVVRIGDAAEEWRSTAEGAWVVAPAGAAAVPAGDPRWPGRCTGCGRPFTATDHHEVRVDRLMRRQGSAEQRPLGDWGSDVIVEEGGKHP